MTLVTDLWNKEVERLWSHFVEQEQLSSSQQEQLKIFVNELLEWNQRCNLTRIVSLPDIIAYHLQDSLRIDHFNVFSPEQTVCDVGSGGGFPGIPLAIKRPDLQIILLEVNQKKIAFLSHVIQVLGFKHVRIVACDWLTFIRKGSEKIDFFVARASLGVNELAHVFHRESKYRRSTLIYWASAQWIMGNAERPFFVKKEAYTVGSADRWYVFFKAA